MSPRGKWDRFMLFLKALVRKGTRQANPEFELDNSTLLVDICYTTNSNPKLEITTNKRSNICCLFHLNLFQKQKSFAFTKLSLTYPLGIEFRPTSLLTFAPRFKIVRFWLKTQFQKSDALRENRTHYSNTLLINTQYCGTRRGLNSLRSHISLLIT